MSDQERRPLDADDPDEPQPEALAEPDDDELDWGGDGSDLSEPVRAHVLAVLQPVNAPYPPPVAALLELGDAHDTQVVERRSALEIGQEHVPDLVRMTRDRGLHAAPNDDPVGWAPIHAAEVLTGLDVSAVAGELVSLFDLQNDWFTSSVPKALGKAGRPALEPIRAYLADHSRWEWGHAHIINALEELGQQHPDLRAEVVDILGMVLRDAEHYSESACSFAMSTLVELEAVEALPLIRRAFEIDKIDEMVRGDWQTILDELGVEPEPDDPLIELSRRRNEERRERFFPREVRDQLSALSARQDEPLSRPAPAPAPSPRKSDKARKAKNKRKTSSASRKANRKRRK